jgi:hypothetical protein
MAPTELSKVYARPYNGRMHGYALFTIFMIRIELSQRQRSVAPRGTTADRLHTQVPPGKLQHHTLACNHFTVEQQAKSTDGSEVRRLHVMRDAPGGENVRVSQAVRVRSCSELASASDRSCSQAR